MFTNESDAYAESEAYDSAFVVPIHTRSELSSDSDSASVGSVASVNQPLTVTERNYPLVVKKAKMLTVKATTPLRPSYIGVNFMEVSVKRGSTVFSGSFL